MLEDEITTVEGLQNLLLALSPDTASKIKRRSFWGYGHSSEQRASRASAAAAATLLQQRGICEPARIVCVCMQDVALSLHVACQLGTLANALDNL